MATSGRILAATKTNLAPEPPALAFRPRLVDETVALAWEGETGHSARDLLSAAPKEERTARKEAADFLRESLRPGRRPRLAPAGGVFEDLLPASGWRPIRRWSN